MQTNRLPQFDASVNTTGCCARFNPEGWDARDLRFRDKPFVRATTRSAMHVPLDMGIVFSRVMERVTAQDGLDPEQFIVLSRDLSPWQSEHLFAVTGPVEGEQMVALTGDFVTRLYEGPYRDARRWHAELKELSQASGIAQGRIYFFYTTCPDCAKAYGKNYIVGLAELLGTDRPSPSEA